MKKYLLIAAILLGFIESLPAVTLSTQAVTSATALAFNETLAIDSAGNMHIAYKDNNRLMYGKRTGGVWSVQQVGSYNGPISIALALNNQDRPVIVFGELGAFVLEYDGSSWTSSMLENSFGFSDFSLAIDGAGRKQVAYADGVNSTLKYAVYDGGVWTKYVIDSSTAIGTPLSMALDTRMNAHILYGDNATNSLKYASHTTTGWLISTVPGINRPNIVSLALDGDGLPRASCMVTTPLTGFHYVTFDGTAWTVNNVTAQGYIDKSILELDGDGIGHIGGVRYNGSAYEVVYTSGTGVDWSTATIENMNFGAAAMALDAGGLPHIVYEDNGVKELRIANGAGTGAAAPMGGGPGGRVQAPTSFAGVPHVSSITWTWTDNAASETGYRIYVASGGTTNYYLIADENTLVADSNSYDWTTLDANTSYYAYVEAVNAGGFVDSARVFRATLARPPSGSAIASITQDTVTVDWLPNGNPEPGTEYQVQVATTVGFSTFTAVVVSSSLAVVPNLLPETTYYFNVRAVNLEGTATVFDAGVSTITLASADVTPPAAVTDLLQTAWTGVVNQVSLSWTAPGDDGGTGVLPNGSEYRIQYSTNDPSTVNWSTSAAQLSGSLFGVFPGQTVSAVFIAPVPRVNTYARVWTKDETSHFSVASDTVVVKAVPFVDEEIRSAVNGTLQTAIDAAGDIHLLFSDSGGLSYIKRTGGVWGSASVIDAGATYGSITVDADAHPHVAYNVTGSRFLKYAYHDGSSWSTTSVDTDGFASGQMSIVLDAGGQPHIGYLYAGGGNAGIRYAAFDGVSWSTATLTAGNASLYGTYPAIALNGAGAPRAFCYPGRFFTLEDGAWSNAEFVSNIAYQPSMAIDGNDIPHYSSYFSFAGNGALFYTTGIFGNGLDGVDPRGPGIEGIGKDSSLVLDGSGYAHIAYLNETNNTVRYAAFNGTTWIFGVATINGRNAASPSLAMNANGDPEIFYFSGADNKIHRAYWTGENSAQSFNGVRGRLGAPSGLTATVQAGGSVKYDWTDNASSEFGYEVYGAASSTGPYTLIVGTNTLGPNAHTYTESNLTLGTTLYRFVTARSSGGVAFSNQATTYVQAPGTPSAFVGTALDVSSITWTWSDNASDETAYRVYSSTNGNLSGDLAANAVTWNETGLSTNTAYSRRVVAVGGVTVSSSAVATRYTLANVPAPAATSVRAVSILGATLTWLPNTNPLNVTTYTVVASTLSSAPGGTGDVSLSTRAGGATPAAVLHGLAEGTTYFFFVRAVNGDGIGSDFVLLGSTCTPVTPPDPSTTSAIGTSGGTISLTGALGTVALTVPAGAFATTISMTVSMPAIFPSPRSRVGTLRGTGIGIQITLAPETQPSVGVPIVFNYDGAVVQALGIDESALVFARYDETSQAWLPLPSVVDKTLHSITATTHHFSTFQLMAPTAASGADHVIIYPNPLRPAIGHNQMLFNNAPAGAAIRIYSRLGELLATRTVDGAGMAAWDGANDSGEKVASGVYYAVVDGPGGKKTYRVAVQR